MAKNGVATKGQPTSTDPEDVKAAGRRLVASLKGGWSPESKQLVSMAVEAGCKARASNDNRHVMLTSPDGKTATVSAAGLQKGNRSHLNNTKQVRAILADLINDRDLATTDTRPGKTVKDVPTGVTVRTTQDALEALKEFRCDLCKPPRQLLNVEALEDHRKELHIWCEKPLENGKPCNSWVKNRHAMGPHNAIYHQGHKPWESTEQWKKAHPPTKGPAGDLLDPTESATTVDEDEGYRKLAEQTARESGETVLTVAEAQALATGRSRKSGGRVRRVETHSLPDQPAEPKEIHGLTPEQSAAVAGRNKEVYEDARKLDRIRAIVDGRPDPVIADQDRKIRDLTEKLGRAEIRVKELEDDAAKLALAREVLGL